MGVLVTGRLYGEGWGFVGISALSFSFTVSLKTAPENEVYLLKFLKTYSSFHKSSKSDACFALTPASFPLDFTSQWPPGGSDATCPALRRLAHGAGYLWAGAGAGAGDREEGEQGLEGGVATTTSPPGTARHLQEPPSASWANST